MTYRNLRRSFPKRLAASPKVWRQTTRQQWRDVVKALDTYVIGSAYKPGGTDLYEIQRLVARISEDIEGDWIAW